ncbi:MAG: class I SAM-dependent methyltransferase [candidate division WOR-3 bacterium]|nr:class I SAM-dependent methyltransferase [candidate division WOR-3 bacterium]
MPIGAFLAKANSAGFLKKLIYRTFGVLDLHTHIRLKPLLKFAKKDTRIFENKVIFELGCGSGINLFETFFINNGVKAIGIDIDCRAIQFANYIAENLGISKNLQFYCEDLNKLKDETMEIIKEYQPNILYLIDFIEHIPNPVELLSKVFDNFKNIDYVFISVPTYRYKKVFGERFHREVGHLRDGYTLREIEDMLSPFGFKLIHHEYNTGFPSDIGCYLYYRIRFSNK